MTDRRLHAGVMRAQPCAQPPNEEKSVTFPVTAKERALLLRLAQLNERDVAGEVRWRLRRLLRSAEALDFERDVQDPS
jgi:hypothetical protein